jgi:hypothetical protein
MGKQVGAFKDTIFLDKGCSMDRLPKICSNNANSRNLILSQIIIWKSEIEASGGELIFEHKFLIKIKWKGECYALKINAYDKEIFLFCDDDEIYKNPRLFTSVKKLKTWFREEIAKVK